MKTRTLYRTLMILLCPFLWSCTPGQSTYNTSSIATTFGSIFSSLMQTNQSAIAAIQNNYTQAQMQAALRLSAEILINRDPTPAEMQTLTNGNFATYQTLITSYLNTPAFQAEQLTYYQDLFGMSGQTNTTFPDINYDEPANLATYLVVNNQDFRQVLTATYCVNDSMQQIPCSAFSNPADATTQAAGVLTTRAFLQNAAGPFNLHRVNKAFEVFACRNYLLSPDIRDPGISQSEISGTVKTFNCADATACNPVCFSCHKNLNSRASLFYNFDLTGMYNLNPSSAVITQTDVVGTPSTVADLLVPGAQAAYFGQVVPNLRQYAMLFSRNKDFRDCLAQRLSNQLLGGQPTDPLLPAMQDIRDHIDLNGFNVKSILLEVAGHPAFVNR
jgi:hypothetical protein